MQVEIVLPSGDKSGTTSTTPSSHVYLEGLKGYPDVRCQPAINGGLAEFKLSLKDFFECGVTRMVNKITVSFYMHNYYKTTTYTFNFMLMQESCNFISLFVNAIRKLGLCMFYDYVFVVPSITNHGFIYCRDVEN